MTASRSDARQQAGPADDTRGAHQAHGWMMLICCIPMLALAVLLVATGVASARFLFAALACTAMMALMVRAMSHGDGTAKDQTPAVASINVCPLYEARWRLGRGSAGLVVSQSERLLEWTSFRKAASLDRYPLPGVPT